MVTVAAAVVVVAGHHNAHRKRGGTFERVTGSQCAYAHRIIAGCYWGAPGSHQFIAENSEIVGGSFRQTIDAGIALSDASLVVSTPRTVPTGALLLTLKLLMVILLSISGAATMQYYRK